MARPLKATRMELLAVRKRIKLARKGHKLLKEKRDALIGEFFSIIKELTTLRERVESVLADAHLQLGGAMAIHGRESVGSAALAVSRELELRVGWRHIMGVRVPLLEIPGGTRKTAEERGYGYVGTSARLDAAVEHFEEALGLVVELAEVELGARALAEEINRTKRKVNALERVLIPRIEDEARRIEMSLEEMERENFARLKTIKRRMERAEAEA